MNLCNRLQFATIAIALFATAACHSTGAAGPYAPNSEGNRDANRAEKLTREAVDCADANPTLAEALLRDALTADLYHGPAHNDLGVLYFREGKLYEAANEFEWARKLMPGHPDPRLNLALVLERSGHVAEAFSAYDAALEVAPEYVPAMEAYAKLAVRERRHDEKTTATLKTLVLRGETDGWREWAAKELARVRTE